MSNLHTNNRLQTVALIAVLHEGDRAKELLEFLGEGDRRACERRITNVIESTQSKRSEKVWQRLNGLIASEKFSGIAEIHPAWILEALKDESPRIMGIIMRYLPSKQVRYILEHLPTNVKTKIPTLLESFAVPNEILDVIRHRFESRFLPIHISKTQERFDFDQIYYLRGGELRLLFAELGLCEIALALAGLGEKLLSVVLNRLKLKDAKRLHLRMDELKGASEELKQQARYAILETEGEYAGSEEMLVEVGMASFAKAVSAEDGETYALIRQKLSPHESYQLKRAIEEQALGNPPALVEERRNVVLKSIAKLASEGSIDQQWERFAPKGQ